MPLYNPKISIIIPSFNQGQFIEETILSVLNQTYTNFEIIIIDGGSIDDTINIIKKYASHILYWISEKDNGQSEAINKGLQRATGDIVTWLNSDDYYENNTLQIVKETFEQHPEASILHGKARLFGNNLKSKTIGLEKDIEPHEYLSYMRFPQPASFFKKEVFSLSNPLNIDLHYTMDFELLVRAILNGHVPKRINVLLANYRLHANSKSNNNLKFLNEWAQVVCSIFNSQKNGAEFSSALKHLQLVSGHTKSVFESQLIFTKKELQTVFLQHLNLHYHYNYQSNNYLVCKKISLYLKQNYSFYYNENKYYYYNFRLKFIPKFVFSVIRSLRG